jgi:CYTH domain-containing protein
VPVENERKFVLKLETPEKEFGKVADFVEDIEQVYLMCGKKQSIRIRKSLLFRIDKYVEFKYKMTFKQDVGKKTVEIETSISPEDYEMLNKQSIMKLRKLRYRVGDWEVDFFRLKEKTYFVQAEIEMPENKKKPDTIHPLIQNNLIYVVKRGDGRFSSKKLGDAKYAQRLMDSILLERQA